MAKDKRPPERIGTQGWKQFLSARQKMLGEYDRACNQDNIHEVQTYRGTVAEAIFRDWLSNFLPGKYGVTSGYIVSQGVRDDRKLPHYDVIIFNQLESPVLWIEDDSDRSAAGASRAIPAEHACAVLEVKSSLTRESAKKAIDHLMDLKPMFCNVDEPNEPYPKFLPNTFKCGCVFFEARKEVAYHKVAFNRLVAPSVQRGYMGALILRGEDLSGDATGYVMPLESPSPMKSSIGRGKESLFGSPLSDTIKVEANAHRGVMLSWNEANFSRFAFDLLAMIAGRWRPGYISSFHGMNFRNPARLGGSQGGSTGPI